MKLPHLFYLNNFNERDSIEKESDMKKKERWNWTGDGDKGGESRIDSSAVFDRFEM